MMPKKAAVIKIVQAMSGEECRRWWRVSICGGKERGSIVPKVGDDLEVWKNLSLIPSLDQAWRHNSKLYQVLRLRICDSLGVD